MTLRRFGRNYPMWMKMSPKHYLYTTPEECCDLWYPSELNCPMAEDDGVQEGYFWLVDEAFFPNWKGDGCGYGNDYPEWMADPTQAKAHLFQTAEECCDLWFPSHSAHCQNTIVYSSVGTQTGGPPNYNNGTWYPTLTSPRWPSSPAASGSRPIAITAASHSSSGGTRWTDSDPV